MFVMTKWQQNSGKYIVISQLVYWDGFLMEEVKPSGGKNTVSNVNKGAMQFMPAVFSLMDLPVILFAHFSGSVLFGNK